MVLYQHIYIHVQTPDCKSMKFETLKIISYSYSCTHHISVNITGFHNAQNSLISDKSCYHLTNLMPEWSYFAVQCSAF